MSATPEVFGIAAVSVLIIATFAVIWSKERSKRSRFREAQLARAVQYLRIHYNALERLDDPSTPPEMVELALWLSKFIHNRKTPALVEKMLREGFMLAEAAKIDRPASAVFLDLQRSRPDLAAAFAESAVAGLLAFGERRPDCAALFEPILLRIASSPGTETERVAHAAKAIRSHDTDDFGRHAPAHA